MSRMKVSFLFFSPSRSTVFGSLFLLRPSLVSFCHEVLMPLWLCKRVVCENECTAVTMEAGGSAQRTIHLPLAHELPLLFLLLAYQSRSSCFSSPPLRSRRRSRSVLENFRL